MYHSPSAKDIFHFIISFIFLAAVVAASHLRGEEIRKDESRGLTSLVLPLPDPKSVVLKSEISGHLHQDADGIQEDGTYMLFTILSMENNCNSVIHEKDRIKRIHYHMASCKSFDRMFGNRLGYMYGIRMISNALQKPFTFTCGMAEGEKPNGAVHLMNYYTNHITGPVPNRNGEEYTVEDICQNICRGMFCNWHTPYLDLVSDSMIVDWRHLTSPIVVPISDHDDAVIHLRLGDGLHSSFGTNEWKGIFPHAIYINLLMQAQQEKGTINSIGIVTAPFKGSNVRSFDQGFTSLSEEIALDLVNALQNAFTKAKISIHNSPDETIMESLARVVHARKVAVCGCSTFCPYPLLATEGIGFMYNPLGQQNQWVKNAVERYDNIRLFETPMLNGLMISNEKTGWKLDHALMMDWVRNQDPNVGNVDIFEAPIFRELTQ